MTTSTTPQEKCDTGTVPLSHTRVTKEPSPCHTAVQRGANRGFGDQNTPIRAPYDQNHGNRTLLDRANPVTRFAAAMILTFPLFITLDWVSASSAAVLELLIWLGFHLASHQISQIRTLFKRILPFLALAPLAGLSLALYGNPGGRIHATWGLITISDQSISYGVAVAARVIAFGTACLVTLGDTDPTDMADGLAQVWHLPVRFVLGTLAGVRLISCLMSDWKTMQLARRARGLGDHGVVRRFATLAFALLVSAIRRGSTLATAMEARGFGHKQRTWARVSTVGIPDVIYLLVAVAIVACGIVTSLVTGDFRWIGDVM